MAKERLEMTGPVNRVPASRGSRMAINFSAREEQWKWHARRDAATPAPTSNPRSKFRSINAKIRFSLSLSFLADQSKRIILQRHPIRSRSINLDNEKYLKECIYMYMYGGTTPSKTVYLINGEGEGRGRATGVTSCR